MEVHLFSVWDSAAARYLDPFCAPTIEFALRGFREAVNTEGHQFNKFPEDYTLFHVGEFDPVSGEVSRTGFTSLGVAITMINRPQLLDEEVSSG